MNDNQPRPTAGAAPRQGRQFFDVVRPGATPASPTSRPVITRPQIKDPNVAISGVGEAVRLTPRQPVSQPNAAVAPVVVASAPPVAATAPSVSQQPQKTVDLSHADSLGKAANVTSVTPPVVIDASTFFAPDNPAQYQTNKHGLLSEVLAIFAIFLLLAVILNILLDAEVIELPVPHTNFFDY